MINIKDHKTKNKSTISIYTHLYALVYRTSGRDQYTAIQRFNRGIAGNVRGGGSSERDARRLPGMKVFGATMIKGTV